MNHRGKKRALPAEGGESMTSTSRPTVDGKKVRFGGGPARDDSEDDDVEPADDLEGPSGRRKAVIKPADGGSSDEESEEEPARDDDDDDMFNSSKAKDVKKDDSSKVRDKGLQLREGAETTSSKGEHYLKLGDLEGQEFNMPDASDSEDEELPEGEDEDANADDAPRSKRSKKGMGYTLSGFNMKQELQEGRMTSDGSYVANKTDPFARHDAWLDASVANKKAMKAAKAAQEAKQRQAAEQDAEQSTGINRAQCMRELVESGLLRSEQGETVLGALTRLGHERKAAVKAQQKAHKASQAKAKADTGGSMELDGETNEEHRMNEVKAQVERLTTLAGTLMDAYGETEVYDWTFDDVVKDLRLEGEVPRGWQPKVSAPATDTTSEAQQQHTAPLKRGLIHRAPAAVASHASVQVDDRRYWYQWSGDSGAPAEQLGKTFGPFGRSEMEAWISMGYFGAADKAERIRVREGNEVEWHSWV